MSHITQTFSDSHAGILRLRFRSTFYSTTARDAGFPAPPASDGSPNIAIRAYLGPNDGTRKKTEPLDRNAPVATLEMFYPGNNAVWPVGTEEVAHLNPPGLFSYGLKSFVIDLALEKK
jgi:hypothetical protein